MKTRNSSVRVKKLGGKLNLGGEGGGESQGSHGLYKTLGMVLYSMKY